MKSDNQSIVENLTSCLKHVYRLTNVILDRYLAQQAKISDWQRLHKVYCHPGISISYFKSINQIIYHPCFMFCIAFYIIDDLFHNLYCRYV